MKRSTLCIFLLVLAGSLISCKKNQTNDPAVSQVNVDGEFRNNYGSSLMCVTDDGGFAIVAIDKDTRLFVAKYSIALDNKWKVSLDTLVSNGGGICSSGDGGVVVAYDNNPANSSFTTLNVIKLNNEGQLVWNKKYRFSFFHGLYFPIRRSSDGGFIIIAQDTLLNSNNVFPTVFKISATGDSLWKNTFPDSYFNDVITDIVLTSDDGIIMVGPRRLIRADNYGNLIWEKLIEGYPTGILRLSDDGAVVLGDLYVGKSADSLGNTQDVILQRFGSDGELVWGKQYSYSLFDYAFSLCAAANDSGYVFSATGDQSSDHYGPIIINTNASGLQISIKNLPGIKPFGLIRSNGQYFYYGVKELYPVGIFSYYHLQLQLFH